MRPIDGTSRDDMLETHGLDMPAPQGDWKLFADRGVVEV